MIRWNERFQSLSGFQVRCNLLRVSSTYMDRKVSIPIGFSSSLQHSLCNCSDSPPDHVSIPIGFSSSLQLGQDHREERDCSEFQSLSGFQVRCNFAPGLRSSVLLGRFNPYRVFKFVATATSRKATNEPGSPVSIPIGFSSSLQLPKPSGAVPSSLWFQSLSGFQVRCNIYLSPLDRWIKEVSIPIGFSSSLQPGYRHDRHDGQHGFNPYRVFKFVATHHLSPYTAGTRTMFQSLSGFQVRCNRRGYRP